MEPNLLLALLFAPPALACGQTTHVWISIDALEHLPPGELRDLLSREALRPMLVHGTMFPDGGYAVGDPYGEMAHWEPFQTAYLEWIRAHHAPPWDDEGARHVAFLMGLASHGMADQVFDATYIERARVYDAASDWAGLSADTATDVVFASLGAAQEVPTRWVPTEVLLPIFAAQGHEVSAQTVGSGQAALAVAVFWVGAAGQNEEEARKYAAQFPWAAAHLQAPVPGSPVVCSGEVIARYWQALWDRLHGRGVMDHVLATFPADGAGGHVRDAGSIESMVSFVMPRGLDPASLDGRVSVADAAGVPHPVSMHLYYGRDSQVVNLRPLEDWAEDADYTVTLAPGLASFDGEALEAPLSFGFSTRAPPAVEEPPVEVEPGCGCRSGSRAGWLAVGLAVGLIRRRR